MPYDRLESRTRRHLFLTIAGLLLNRRDIRKQIKATTRGQPRPRYQDESYHADPSRSHGRYPNDVWDIINAKRHGQLADETDRFPAFSQNINYAEYPTGFNPVNMQNLKKYDGKQDPVRIEGEPSLVVKSFILSRS